MSDTNSIDKKFCACGCGQIIITPDKSGRVHKFKRGHNAKQDVRGDKNPNWHGGLYINCRGYRMIKTPNHPYADCRGYVMEHRLVMEQHLGRYLKPEENVHHINDVKHDNRIENLDLIADFRTHIKRHRREFQEQVLFKRVCFLCKSNKTWYYKKRNSYKWYRHPITKQEWVCTNCYRKESRLIGFIR